MNNKKFILPGILGAIILILAVALSFTLGKLSSQNDPVVTTGTSGAGGTATVDSVDEPVTPQNPENSDTVATSEIPDLTSDNNGNTATDEVPTDTETPPETVIVEQQDGVWAEFTIVDGNWEENGKTATRVIVKIINDSDKEIKDWSITVEVPPNAEISSGHNSEFSISGNQLTITKGSHGRDLKPGESYPDVGFIILADEGFDVN